MIGNSSSGLLEMPTFQCVRCGYVTNRVSNYKKHLQTKKCCPAFYADVDRNEVLASLDQNHCKQAPRSLPNISNVPEKSQSTVINTLQKNLLRSQAQNVINTLQKNLHRLQTSNEDLRAQNEDLKNQLDAKQAEAPSVDVDATDAGEGVCACGAVFETVDDLENHMRAECKMAMQFNNVYAYEKGTFGRAMYGGAAGDIYIVQTDFTPGERVYKVGKTTDVSRRMVQYRTGAVREPRLHYYYPFRDVSRADDDVKGLLKNFHLKRELYAGDLEAIRAAIRGYQLRTDGCLAEFAPRLSAPRPSAPRPSAPTVIGASSA